MQRRNFVMSVLAGSLAVPAIADQGRGRGGPGGQGDEHEHGQGHGPREDLSGPLANATVTFGAWRTTPALDRFLVPTPVTANAHEVLPFEARIKAGGAVNFLISGFHILGVYGPGTELSDVNGSLTMAIPNAPPGFPPVVNDPLNRIYRGVNPFDLALDRFGPSIDRSENVHFTEPGRYLVVCLFVPHFNEQMHGFVNVLP